MYCPSCGNEITVELKYCNRCGANLTLPAMSPPTAAPVKLAVPSIVLGLTVIAGLGIIFGGATEFVRNGVPPVALVWAQEKMPHSKTANRTIPRNLMFPHLSDGFAQRRLCLRAGFVNSLVAQCFNGIHAGGLHRRP